MDTIAQATAATLASALVVGVVTAAFIRPKLFMRLYPNLLIGCLVGVSFGLGVAVGGRIVSGYWLAAGFGMAAGALILVLAPAARQEAKEAARGEDGNRDDP